MSTILYTIGHSSHPIEHFLSLLMQHGVRCVADIRSKPFSRFHPQYNQNALRSILEENGIQYVFMGKSLGGRPDDPTCYSPGPDGKPIVDYAHIAQRPWFQQGLEELVSLSARQPTAILCAEADPKDCHRHWLVARNLAGKQPAMQVQHILKDGRLVSVKTLLGSPTSQLPFQQI